VLIIADWDSVFENALSRKIETLPWIRMPNRHDGDSFIELLQGHKDGLAHYGCWCLLVQVASKTKNRGILTRKDGSPHTAESVSRIVRADQTIMQEAITRLLAIGWLIEKNDNTSRVVSEIPAGCQSDGPSRVEKPSGEERRGEYKRVEEILPESSPSASGQVIEGQGVGKRIKNPKLSQQQVDDIYAAYPRKEKPRDAKLAIEKAFKLPECREAAEWHEDRDDSDNIDMVYEFLLERTKRYALYCAKHEGDLKRNGQNFIPYPQTWFNAQSYLIDHETNKHILQDAIPC